MSDDKAMELLDALAERRSAAHALDMIKAALAAARQEERERTIAILDRLWARSGSFNARAVLKEAVAAIRELEDQEPPMPTSKEHMAIGMEIAEKHRAWVKQCADAVGEYSEAALNGCMVALAAEIMKALDCATQEPTDG